MVSPGLAAAGRRLRRRVLVLAALEGCLFAGMLHACVLDLGGWRHVRRVGVLEALTQYLMRPLNAIMHPQAQATAEAWRGVYVMAGLLLAIAVVGLLLKRACADWRRYRLYRQLQEWQQS